MLLLGHPGYLLSTVMVMTIQDWALLVLDCLDMHAQISGIFEANSGPQVQIQDDPGKSKMYDLYGIYSHSFKLDINTKDPISDHWQTNEFGVNSLTCFTYWISFCQTIGRMTLPSQKYLDVTLTKPINWTITLECNITKLTLRCRKIPRVQPWIEPWRWKYNHIPIKDNTTARLWKWLLMRILKH